MSANESPDDRVPVAQPPADETRKRKILVWLLVYSAILGPVYVFLPDENGVLDTLLYLPFLVLGVAWCHSDARQRSFRLGRTWSLFLIFVFVIALPSYIFRTRGIRGIKTLLLALAVLVLMMVCMIATMLVTLLTVDAIWPGYARDLLHMAG